MQTSEVLNRAADLIEKRGWTSGASGWGTRDAGQPLCLEGGILAALGTNYIDVSLREWYDACPASEVIEVLRACAVIEASREREAAEVSA